MRGAFEFLVVAKAAASAGFDGLVALGVVIRGGCPVRPRLQGGHRGSHRRWSVLTGVLVGFDLLTCGNEEQALQPSGLPAATENKGCGTAEAALATLQGLRSLKVR